MFDRWCDAEKDDDGSKHYWAYIEKSGGRGTVMPELAKKICSHYLNQKNIDFILENLGYESLKNNLCQELPEKKTYGQEI